MLRLTATTWTILLAACLAGCAGKAEHGSGTSGADPAPVQKPAAGPVNAEPPRAEPPRHLLMVVELEPATRVARTLTSSSVELPLPRRRGPARKAPWRVEVLGTSGQVLYTAPLDDAATVRGEFRDDKTGQLTGTTVQRRVAAVTLRLPWLEGASQVRIVSVNEGGDSELGTVPYPQVTP